MKKNVSAINIILLVLSLILCAGTKFAFHACAAKPDGSWMLCHWAECAVFALGIALVLLSAARFFVADGIRAGISLSFVPLSIVTLLIPGVVVPLCMMKDMRCHTVMRPAVIVLCVLIAALSVIDFLVHQKRAKEA